MSSMTNESECILSQHAIEFNSVCVTATPNSTLIRSLSSVKLYTTTSEAVVPQDTTESAKVQESTV